MEKVSLLKMSIYFELMNKKRIHFQFCLLQGMGTASIMSSFQGPGSYRAFYTANQ